ncbi:MAG: VTT domain-containing protein [Pseudomonadota bacterium]
MQHETLAGSAPAQKKPIWLRALPIVIIVGALAALKITGATDYFSFKALQEFQGDLRSWAGQYPILAPLAVIAVYAIGTAVSVPGMVWVTLAAGFLFGTLIGTVTVVIGATLGAVTIFLAARYAFADVLRAKIGKWLDKMDAEMAGNQISYLLTIRLIPVIPFWIANLAPAFFDVKARTFAWTTFVGIIPVVAVYCSVGAGIGALLDTGQEPNLGAILLNPKVILPLAALIGFSTLPIIVRKFKQRKAGA